MAGEKRQVHMKTSKGLLGYVPVKRKRSFKRRWLAVVANAIGIPTCIILASDLRCNDPDSLIRSWVAAHDVTDAGLSRMDSFVGTSGVRGEDGKLRLTFDLASSPNRTSKATSPADTSRPLSLHGTSPDVLVAEGIRTKWLIEEDSLTGNP